MGNTEITIRLIVLGLFLPVFIGSIFLIFYRIDKKREALALKKEEDEFRNGKKKNE